jgi:hypothetical protein
MVGLSISVESPDRTTLGRDLGPGIGFLRGGCGATLDRATVRRRQLVGLMGPLQDELQSPGGPGQFSAQQFDLHLLRLLEPTLPPSRPPRPLPPVWCRPVGFVGEQDQLSALT